jgi:CHAT domain-containing protein/Tfp pilus assembly protein PilF
MHFHRSDYDLSQQAAESSLALWREVGDDEGIAECHNLLGNVWGARHSYTRALEYYELALASHQRRGAQAAIGAMLSNIATVHIWVGNYRVAAAYLRRAVAMQAAGGFRRSEAQATMNLAIVDMVLGDHARALEGYLRVLRVLEELDSRRDTGRVLNNIGSLYRQQGNYGLAADYFERAMEVHRANGDQHGVGETLWSLALLSESQGRLDEALGHARSSLEIYEGIGAVANAAGVVRSLGSIHRERGEYEAARADYQRSLDLYTEVGSRSGEADVLSDLAALAALGGRDDEALRQASQAVDAAREMGIRDLLWRSLTQAGAAARRLGRHDEARVVLEEAIRVIEELRENVAGGDLDRQSFFEDKVEPYQELVSLLVAAGDHAGAFSYLERTKARALLDVLERSQATVNGAMTAEEAAREELLVSRLTLLNSELYAARSDDALAADAARVAEIERRIERARLDLAVFHGELYSAHPELAVNRGEARPIDVEAAGALVESPARALLSFFVTSEATYLFVLAADAAGAKPRLTVHHLAATQAALARDVEQFRLALARLDPRFGESSRRLYDLLIAPAAAELAGRTELVIVPDGVLWELPFQALAPAPGRYLIERHAVSYAPSLTALAAMRARRGERRDPAPARQTLLAFGNPDFGVETRRRAEHVLMSGTLAPLPEAGRQVEALERLYGADRARVYVGAEAREDRAKTEADGYRILQFATHGTLVDSSPMYSHLVLAHPDGDGEDGLLEAWELMGLDLRADLVVLAACETARGRVRTGEGVIGMSWALFVAGASTTVVSQWKVESASTTELMLAFHRALGQPPAGAAAAMPVGEALRQASLRLLEDPRYRHPFYWAGFVAVGVS